MKKIGVLSFGSILAAIAASLCCITPVLALIAGAGGFASAFSWLEPARPYLIGLTVLVLGTAWYSKLRPKNQEADCECEEDKKTSFFQTKTFLGIITVFAALMIAFPYYGQIFYPKPAAKLVIVESNNIKEANFTIAGMDCATCEEHVKHAVSKLPGIVDVKADYNAGTVGVKFDSTKVSLSGIVSAIDETGYTVTQRTKIGASVNPKDKCCQ